MKDLIKYSVFAILILSSQRISAQDESLLLVLDKSEIKIGEQIEATLTLRQAVTSNLNLPMFLA